MSTEQKDTEQNALAAKLGRTWDSFKQGKLVSYKVMAITLIVVAALGTWWYISAEGKKARSQRWMELDTASSPDQLRELIKNNPDAITARLAELQLARAELGRDGLDRFYSAVPGDKQKGVENVEKGREALGQWLDRIANDDVLKNDPVFRAECLWGLAMAEEGLVGVPKDAAAPTGVTPAAPSTEFRGSVDKLLDYLDKVAALQDANPGIEIPWSKQARERAESIRKDKEKFQKTAQKLFQSAATSDPFGGSPLAPKKN